MLPPDNKLLITGFLSLCIIFLLPCISQGQVVCSYTAVNDLCDNAITIDGNSFSANTCCGNIEDISLCVNAQTGVWYHYEQTASATVINIENLSIGGGIGIEIYAGSCDNLTLLERSDCSGFTSREFEVPNCNGQLFIHVSSSRDGCGEFLISASEITGCDFADNCEDITPAQILSPVADGAQVCASSCLDYSCVSTCTDASVWFRFDTDDLTTAVQLLINDAEFDPLISVYRGNTCADFDDLILCSAVDPGEFIDLAVTPDFTYYVEISLASGNPGDFSLCINAIQDYIECSSGVLTITRPENPGASTDGPFCPGETVLFCYDLEFFVDTPDQGNGCQWLQGIVPVVGGGWDLTANDLQSQNPLNWLWFDDVDYNVDSPVLALGTDPFGNKTIEYGPGGMQAGDILPGGWYYVSNGTNAGCTNDGHPDNMWGINTPCGQVFNFSHCFELTAKSVSDISDCDDSFLKDLSVTLFNFADGETGCYTSLACSGDTPVRFEGQLDCSNLVELNATTGEEICSGDFADIPVEVVGGYEIPLIVEVLDPGNTTGAQDWVFETGAGLIPDQIVNLGNDVETIQYRVSFYEPETDCNSPVLEFEVLVHPEFSITMDTLHVICEGQSQLMSAPAGHDDYAWFDAETNRFLGDSRHLFTDSTGYYRVEVTEDLCTATEIVHVIVNERLPQALAISELEVCNNYIGTLETSLDLVQYQMNGIQGNWIDHNNDIISSPEEVEFEGFSAGSYLFQFVTTSAPVPCPDTTYNIEILVEDCQCPDIDIIAPLDFCALNQQFELNNINATVDDGDWTLISGPDLASIEISGTMMNITSDTEEGMYGLQFSLSDPDLAPLCQEDSVVFFNVYQTPEANITAFGEACNEYTGTLNDFVDLDDYNISGTSGSWSSANGSLTIDTDNIVSFDGLDPDNYVFYFNTDIAQAPCLDQQYQTTISLRDCSCPEIELIELGDQCIGGQQIDLESLEAVAMNGEWSLASGADINSLELVGSILTIDDNTQVGNYTLRFSLTDSDIGPLCPMYEEISFSINPEVEASITPLTELCNTYTGTLETSIDLDDLIQTTSSGFWTSDNPGISIDAENRVDFNSEAAQNYVFRFTTDDALEPCPNQEYALAIKVLDCSCPENSLFPIPDQCNENTSIDLGNFRSGPENGNWSIESGPDINSINLQGNLLAVSENTEPGVYTLRYTNSDPDLPPLCPSFEEISMTVNPRVEVDIIDYTELCNEFTGTLETSIDLDDLIQTSNSGDWSSLNPGTSINVDNVVSFQSSDVGSYGFRFTSNDAISPCQNQDYDITVEVLDCSCPENILLPIPEQCNETASVDLANYRTGPENGQWTIENGPNVNSISLQDQLVMISENTAAGEYILRYTIMDPDLPPLCPSYEEISLTVNPRVEVDIIDYTELCNEFTGTLETSIDLDDLIQTSNSGDWSSLNPGISINADNVVSFQSSDVGSYGFRFTSNDAISPCQNKDYDITVEVLDCSCPENILLPLPEQCNETASVDLANFRTGPENGQWTIENGPDVNSISLQDQLVMLSENTAAGEYILRYTIMDPDLPPLCPSYEEISLTVNPRVEVDIIDYTELCNEFTGTLETSIDLDDLIQTSNSGDWSSLNPGISINADNVVSFQSSDVGSYGFRFTSNDAISPCQNQDYDITVEVLDCSCPENVLMPVPDQCNEIGVIDLGEYRSGPDNGLWSLIDGADPASLELEDSELRINENTVPGEYTLRYTITGEFIPPLCPEYEEIVIIIHPRVEAQIIDHTELCNEFTGGFETSIDLNELIITNNSGSWISNQSEAIIGADNIVDFEGLPPAIYSFGYTTNDAIDPCINQTYQVEINLLDCSCPSVSIRDLENQCIEDKTIDLDDLKITTEDGSWQIIDGNTSNSLDLNGSELTISDTTEPGLIRLEFAISDNDIGPLCPRTSEIEFELIAPVEAVIEPEFTVCNTYTGTLETNLDLDDLIETTHSGTWSSQGPGVVIESDNRVDFESIPLGDYVFIYTTDDARDPCLNKSYETTISVIDCSCPSIEILAPDDQCQSMQFIDLDDLKVTGEDGVWELVGGPDIGSVSLNGSMLNISTTTEPGLYTLAFVIEGVGAGPLCPLRSEIELNIYPRVELEIVPQVELCNEFTGTLETSIVLDGLLTTTHTGNWISENPLVNIETDNSVEFAGMNPGTYTFRFATDSASFPCEDDEVETNILVQDCSCPDLAISPIGDFCIENLAINLEDLIIEGSPGQWSLQSGPDLNGVDLSGSALDIFDNSPAGEYVLRYTLSDPDIGPLCDRYRETVFNLYQPVQAEIAETASVCNEDTGTFPDFLDLDDFNISSSAGVWESSDPDVIIDQDNIVEFTSKDIRQYQFRFTTNTAIDPCQDQSYELLVDMLDCSCPDMQLSPLGEFCIEDFELNLNDYKITEEPGFWHLESGPSMNDISLSGSIIDIPANALPGLYTVRFELANQDIGPDCPISSSMDFMLIAPPSAVILEGAVLCNEDNGAEPDFIDLDELNPGDYPGQWSSVDNLFIDSDGVVSLAGQAPGSYDFIFQTDNAVDPCAEVEYLATISVKDCSCPAIVVANPDDLCLEQQVIDLGELLIDADAGSWSIASQSNNPPIISDNELIIENNTSSGLHTLTYTLNDQNLPPDCVSVVDFDFSIHEMPIAELTPGVTLCNNYIGSLETSIDLDELFISGAEGDWLSMSSLISIDADNRVDLEGLDAGLYEFMYRTSEAVAPCEDQEFGVMIQLEDCKCPILELEEIPDLCIEATSLVLDEYLNAENPGTWEVLTANSFALDANGILSIPADANPGDYIIEFSFDDQNLPSLCSFSAQTNLHLVAPPELELVPDILACNSDDSGLAPSVILLDDYIIGDDGEWRALTSGVDITGDNFVSFEGLNEGLYVFEYTTNTAVDPCEEKTALLSVSLENCICPVIAFAQAPVLCNENEILDLSQFPLQGVPEGSWTQVDGPENLDSRISGEQIDLDGVQAGIYRFMYTLLNPVPQGCDNTDTFEFQVNAAVEPEVWNDISVCDRPSSIADHCIDLLDIKDESQGFWTADPMYTGDFSDLENICFDGMQAGSEFTFTYTSQSALPGCEEKTSQLIVTISDCSCPILDLIDAGPFCNNAVDINLDDYKTLETVDGSWQFIQGPQNLLVINSIVEILDAPAGMYEYEYIPLDQVPASCPQSAILAFEISEYLDAGTARDTLLCQGDPGILTLESLQSDFDVGGIWTQISGPLLSDELFDSESGTLSTAGINPGIYRFSYEQNPEAPCQAGSAEIEIQISENPVADAGDDVSLTCENQYAILGGQNMSSGNNMLYEWMHEDSGTAIAGNLAQPDVYEHGRYLLTVTDMMSGCSDTDEVIVEDLIDELYFEVLVDEFDCASQLNGALNFINMSGGDGNYIFSFDGGASWSESIVYNDLPPGIYNIIMQDGMGCEFIIEGIQISEPVNLNVWLGEDIEVPYGDEFYEFTLDMDAEPDQVQNIVWTLDDEVICDGDYEDCLTVEIDPYVENLLCVTVTDQNNCTDSDCIFIEELIEVNVYIPNVFRPSGYTKNALFYVQASEHVETVTTFRVLDRWGGIVFEHIEAHKPNDPKQAWDGTWLEKDVMPGVYTYHIVVEDVFGESHSFAGEVTLLR